MELQSTASNSHGLKFAVRFPLNLSGSEQQLSGFDLLLALPIQVSEIEAPESPLPAASEEASPTVANSNNTSDKNNDRIEEERSEDSDSSATNTPACLANLCDLPKPSDQAAEGLKADPDAETTAAGAAQKSEQQIDHGLTGEQTSAAPAGGESAELSTPETAGQSEQSPQDPQSLQQGDGGQIESPTSNVERPSDKPSRETDADGLTNKPAISPVQATESAGQFNDTASEQSQKEGGAQSSQSELETLQPTTQPSQDSERSRSTEKGPDKWYERGDDYQNEPADLAKTAAASAAPGGDNSQANQLLDSAGQAGANSEAPTGPNTVNQSSQPNTNVSPAVANPALTGSIPTDVKSAAGISSGSTNSSGTDSVNGTTGNSARNQSKLGPDATTDARYPDGTVDLSRAEKARMVQRVARSFSRIGPTGGNVQLKLHPPELGALSVQVKMEGRSMSAKLTTESQAARQTILESLPQLRSRLAEQGYDVTQFTVDVVSDDSALGNQTSFDNSNQSSNSSNSNSSSQPGSDLRRSRNLRRQLDSVTTGPRPLAAYVSSRGIDIQA